MEFEELQKVWDEQKGETMFIINERALHKTVTRRKNATARKINRAEILLSVINSVVLLALLILQFNNPRTAGFFNIGIVSASLVYIWYFRRKRKQTESSFDRSILGELNHALANANAIIRFNYVVFIGYLVPMSVVCFFVLVSKGASLEKWIFTAGMFLLSFFVVRQEQKACNIPRKKQLLALRKKLTEE